MSILERQVGLARILEQSLNEVFVFDAETLRFLFVNEGARKNLGYSMEELRDRTPLDLKPDYTREGFDALLAPLRSGAEPEVVFETVHRRKDGTDYDVEVHVQPGEYDGAPAFAAIILDVTRRKRAERELWLFKQVVDHSVTPIVFADLDGCLRHANAAFVEAWGFADASEVVGRSNAEFAASAEQVDEIMTALRENGSWSGECTARRKDGSTFEVYLTASRVPDQSGAPTGGMATFIDITEQKRLREEFQRAQKMEAVGRLAGGIAHDFNNLLAGIITGCSVARKGLSEGDPSRAILDQVEQQALRGAEVTRQLLDFSRSHASQYEPVDLCEVVAHAEGLWRLLVGEDIEVGIRLDCTGCVVVADPAHVEQVLANLVVNARDAMPRGGALSIEADDVTLGAEGDAERGKYSPADLPPGDYVRVAVRDTGCGMDAETLEKACEPFFTTKEQGKGTGLGLASVYGLVTGMGGGLELESEVDVGTTVRVLLPTVQDRATERPSVERSSPEVEGSGRLLVVEDDTLLRAGIRRMLMNLGYDVVVAEDPRLALEVLADEAERIDLLLTDVVMPGMSGAELADRALAQLPGLKVLYMSGFSGDLLEEQGRVGPGVVVLEKPFTEETLATTVRDALAGG